MKVLSVSVGRVATLFARADGAGGANVVQSAIRKTPVSTLADPRAIAVGPLGLDGDEQADPRLHGGPRKAVYAYPFEHYSVWQTIRLQATRRDEVLPHGYLGENLTLSGIQETQVWVGDVLAIGSAVFRAVAPREPCFKLNLRMGFGHAAKMMVQSGYTGFYLEVMKPGALAAGDAITLKPGERLVRIDEMHRALTTGKQRELL
jgi:MOSC domain-containing protein YiiM